MNATTPNVASKSFTSYLQVRERAVDIAKQAAEKLNKEALTKVKKQKIVEKYNKDCKEDVKDKL